jgi:hypothetical protein
MDAASRPRDAGAAAQQTDTFDTGAMAQQTDTFDTYGAPLNLKRDASLRRCRQKLREFLNCIHVTDTRPERMSVLTVDGSLQMHGILGSILEFQHHHASAWSPPDVVNRDLVDH